MTKLSNTLRVAGSAAFMLATIGYASAQTATGTVVQQHSGPECIKFRVLTAGGATAYQLAIPNGTNFDSLRADWVEAAAKGMPRAFVADPSGTPPTCVGADQIFTLYQIN